MKIPTLFSLGETKVISCLACPDPSRIMSKYSTILTLGETWVDLKVGLKMKKPGINGIPGLMLNGKERLLGVNNERPIGLPIPTMGPSYDVQISILAPLKGHFPSVSRRKVNVGSVHRVTSLWNFYTNVN